MTDGNRFLTTCTLMLGAGLAGAAAALLLAPQSGKKTRRQLKRFSSDLAHRAEDFRADLREAVDDLLDDFSRVGSENLAKGKKLTSGVRDELKDTLESGRELLAKQKERVEHLLGRESVH